MSSLEFTLAPEPEFASREAGREESIEALLAEGLQLGLDLVGWSLSGEMLRQLQEALPIQRDNLTRIEQDTLGGGGLWLRAEPGEDPAQADALAAVIAIGIAT